MCEETKAQGTTEGTRPSVLIMGNSVAGRLNRCRKVASVCASSIDRVLAAKLRALRAPWRKHKTLKRARGDVRQFARSHGSQLVLQLLVVSAQFALVYLELFVLRTRAVSFLECRLGGRCWTVCLMAEQGEPLRTWSFSSVSFVLASRSTSTSLLRSSLSSRRSARLSFMCAMCCRSSGVLSARSATFHITRRRR